VPTSQALSSLAPLAQPRPQEAVRTDDYLIGGANTTFAGLYVSSVITRIVSYGENDRGPEMGLCLQLVSPSIAGAREAIPSAAKRRQKGKTAVRLTMLFQGN